VGEECAIFELSCWEIQAVRLPMDMSVSTVGFALHFRGCHFFDKRSLNGFRGGIGWRADLAVPRSWAVAQLESLGIGERHLLPPGSTQGIKYQPLPSCSLPSILGAGSSPAPAIGCDNPCSRQLGASRPYRLAHV